MKFYELELEGETLKFRLTSNDCMVIEKVTGKSILEYVQNMSMTMVVTMLRYMRRSSVPNFSERDAQELFDKLVDNEYTIARIVNEIILEGLVVSGFMSKEELTGAKDTAKNQ